MGGRHSMGGILLAAAGLALASAAAAPASASSGERERGRTGRTTPPPRAERKARSSSLDRMLRQAKRRA